MDSPPQESEGAQINLRRATPADIGQLWPLLERYYSEWDIWQRDGREKVLDDLHQRAPFGFIVAELSLKLVGCVLVRPMSSHDAAECKRLFVSPESRGHGIASRLVSFAETLAAANGIVSMYLDSKPEFAAALVLYRKRGYLECPRYNDNPQATFFFRKQLRPGAA